MPPHVKIITRYALRVKGARRATLFKRAAACFYFYR